MAFGGLPTDKFGHDATLPVTLPSQWRRDKLAIVLTELASQHERLGQVGTDLFKVLSAARSAVGHAQDLLSDISLALPAHGHLLQQMQQPQQPQQAHGDKEELESTGRASMLSSDASVHQLAVSPRTLPFKQQLPPEVCKLDSDEPSVPWEDSNIGAADLRRMLPRQRHKVPPHPAVSHKASRRSPGAGARRVRRGSLGSNASAGSGAVLPQGVASGKHPSALELLEVCAERRERPRPAALARQVSREEPDKPDQDEDEDWDLRESHGAHSHGAHSPHSSMTIESRHEDHQHIRRNAVLRMQARLGKRSYKDAVTAYEILRSVTSLGLVAYTEHDIDQWLQALQSVSDNRDSFMQQGRLARTVSKMKRKGSTVDGRRFSTFDEGREAPELAMSGNDAGISFRAFAEVLLDDEALSNLDPKYQEMTLTVREVLFSGDANRLVAELTNVRVDDVAAPIRRANFMTYFEPIAGVVIMVNGLVIGLESSDMSGERDQQWFWINFGFTVFFLLELILRLSRTGPRKFFICQDRKWNAFDSVLLFISVVDISLEFSSAAGSVGQQLSVMRLVRLTRVTRLLRLLRMKFMKELNLMVKGLIGGLCTLAWAVVLLFFTLYVIAIFVTNTIGRDPNGVPGLAEDELFSSVPRAVFTSFRCFVGDCTSANGKPIVKLLSDRYGVVFVLAYFASMIFVTFGLFSLIMAIYIENTLNAAKSEGEKNRAQRQRESVRIAQLTRQLLKKFCAAQRLQMMSVNGEADSGQVKRVMHAANFDDVGDMATPVSKELFLCLIQDSSVQKLMDDMDIPPDRASLFDILDADASGGLEVSELITGLLRVRGEAKRSDVVGTLLAVRCVQEMLREQGQRLETMEAQIRQGLTPALCTEFSSGDVLREGYAKGRVPSMTRSKTGMLNLMGGKGDEDSP